MPIVSRRALLLINRTARQGQEMAGAVLEGLRESGIEVLEDAPRHGESLSHVIVRNRERVELVIVAGGDGTLNAAIEGLLETGLPVGVLPLGTANDLARTLGLPLDVLAACQVIAAGHTRPIDVGRVNDKYFLNVASIGLSVAITRGLTKEVKRAWGILAYLRTAMVALYRARLFRAEIRAGEQSYQVWTLQIAVGNGRHYGGGMTVSEDAEIDDHLLDLYSLEIEHFWQILLLLPRLRSGTLSASKYVRTLRGRSFEVIPRRPRSINTDGEITHRTPARFDVLQQALTVFVPHTEPN